MITFLSASLIFCTTTCLAVAAATRPKSRGVTSSSIVSPYSMLGTISLASSKVKSTSGLKIKLPSSSTPSSLRTVLKE